MFKVGDQVITYGHPRTGSISIYEVVSVGLRYVDVKYIGEVVNGTLQTTRPHNTINYGIFFEAIELFKAREGIKRKLPSWW